MWWRNWDEHGNRRLEASIVDETPRGIVFEFCEAGGTWRLFHCPVLLCISHFGLWMFGGVGCDVTFAAVGHVLILSARLCRAVLGFVNTLFLSMHRHTSFAFSRKSVASFRKQDRKSVV